MTTSKESNTTDNLHTILRHFPYHLYAIGVGKEPEEANGFIASWVMQSSFEPPMITVAIRNDSASCELLRRHGVFSINLLGKKQEEIARSLVRPHHRSEEKLDDFNHAAEMTGAPVLKEAMAFVECRVQELVPSGDHLLAIGEVVNSGERSLEPVMSCADMGWHYGG